MTNPGDVGELDATLRVDTDKTSNDVRDGLEKAGRDNEPVAEEQGEKLSDAFGKGWRKKSKEHLNLIGKDLEGALGEISVDASLDLGFSDQDEERARRGGRNLGRRLLDGFSDFFTSRKGAFSNLFQSLIAGPVGALFNIGGSSPLLVLLIPLLGFIVTLVTAAVYGLSAFVSLLYLIPSLLFGIGLQAAALFFIFGGLSEVIGAALTAKNAEELEAALAGVNKEAADVIRQFLPWRDFFTELRDLAQTAFFGAIGDDALIRVLDNIRGPFSAAITSISGALGGVATNLLDVFASPTFAKLIQVLGDSTTQWLQGFGPALGQFLDGLNKFALAIDPFLDWFGDAFNRTIAGWGDQLADLGRNKDFLQFLDDAKVIMKDFLELLGAIGGAVITFVQQFIAADKEMTEAHGIGFLDTITELTKLFTEFLASESGKDAIKGFITILLILTGAFYALAIGILFFMSIFQKVFEVIEWLWQKIFGDFNKEKLDEATGKVKAWGTEFAGALGSIAVSAVTGFLEGFIIHPEQVLAVLRAVHASVMAFFSTAGDWLFTTGKNIIQGLANGIINGINTILGPALTAAGRYILMYFPHSPAELGPLSGSGDPKYAGANIIKRIAAGITDTTPQLTNALTNAANNVNFGSGAVQVNYQGPTPPTQQQMQTMGAAAGTGIINQLTATRIAVRTL